MNEPENKLPHEEVIKILQLRSSIHGYKKGDSDRIDIKRLLDEYYELISE